MTSRFKCYDGCVNRCTLEVSEIEVRIDRLERIIRCVKMWNEMSAYDKLNAIYDKYNAEDNNENEKEEIERIRRLNCDDKYQIYHVGTVLKKLLALPDLFVNGPCVYLKDNSLKGYEKMLRMERIRLAKMI